MRKGKLVCCLSARSRLSQMEEIKNLLSTVFFCFVGDLRVFLTFTILLKLANCGLLQNKLKGQYKAENDQMIRFKKEVILFSLFC